MRSAISLDFYFVVITLLTMINLVVTLKRRSVNKGAHGFLTVMLWMYWYSILIGLVTMSSLIDRMPHVFRTAHATTLLFMPASYLYVRKTLHPDRRLSLMDLIHLVPLAVFLIDYGPFFLLPGQKKLDIIHAMDARSLQVQLKEGWFMPAYYHITIRYFMMSVYWFAQVIMIRNAFGPNSSDPVLSTSSRHWLKWLSFCQLLIILPSLYGILFSSQDFARAFFLQSTSLLGAILLGGYLVFNPEIFYGWQPDIQEVVTEEPQDRSRSAVLSPEVIADLDARMNDLIARTPFWRNQGYRLADLANDTGTTTHQISAYLNQSRNLNFYDFMNSLRVNEFICQIGNEDWKSHTLEAMAKSSGFSNRITFLRAFKKVKGVTPSAFIKNQVGN